MAFGHDINLSEMNALEENGRLERQLKQTALHCKILLECLGSIGDEQRFAGYPQDISLGLIRKSIKRLEELNLVEVTHDKRTEERTEQTEAPTTKVIRQTKCFGV